MEPQNPVQQEAAQVEQPSLFERHKIIFITLISIIGLFIVVVLAVVIIADRAIVTLRDGCAEKDSRLQTEADSLEKQLKSISINGTSPGEVKTWKNGDCLTGTGAVGTVSFFNFPYSNTNEANEGVAKSLHATTSLSNKSFIFGDNDGDGLVEFLQTEMRNSVDSKTYEVKYYLINKIACPDRGYGSTICVRGETSADIDKYASKPINKIVLGVGMPTN